MKPHLLSITVWILIALVRGDDEYRQKPAVLVFPPYGHSYGVRKATQKHLSMLTMFRARFKDPRGLATAKMKTRDDPSTENDDDELVVYGVNSGAHQLIYNTSMWTIGLYGKKGSGKGEFFYPRDVCTNADGHVFVVDSGNNRIVHLFNPEKEVEWVSAFRGAAKPFGPLTAPSQIGIKADCGVFVSDCGNHRVVWFDSSGSIQRVYPANNEFGFVHGPTTLAVADGAEPWSYFKRDRFFVCADQNGTRIWKIDFNGKRLRTVAMPAGKRACSAAADYYHNIWITDFNSHCVLKFDRNLELLDTFGSYGEGDNQFNEPRGIAIWKRFGQVFIAEKGGAQYYWIGTSMDSHALRSRKKNRFDLSINLNEFSYVSIFSETDGDTVFTFKHKWIIPGGVTVPFTDPSRTLSTRLKRSWIRIEPVYSSYTYYHWDFPLHVVP